MFEVRTNAKSRSATCCFFKGRVAARPLVVLTVWIMAVMCLNAQTFSRLQLLLPGETAAPGTGSGKTGTPFVQAAGLPFTVTVNAVDANWNVINTNDVIGLKSSDASAVLPNNAALEAGTKTFTVTLMTVGSASITASNLTHPTITSGISPEIVVTPGQIPGLEFNFTYNNRQELLAAGWNFIARTAAGASRNTEITNSGSGPVISYDQTAHPGVVQLPTGAGDLWDNSNNSQNNLFRNLPTNWTSLQLEFSFAPNWPYQQANLALYQDDDNYVEVGVTHQHTVALVQEVAGVPSELSSVGITGTNIHVRLDRDVNFGELSSFYSLDGTNWVYTGKIGQELINPRLCIWAGASLSGTPYVDLRRLRIATSPMPFPSTLALQPLALVFNSVVGRANTNVQRINIYHRGPDGFKWSVTDNASWLSVNSTTGAVPGFCDISVSTTGLTNGIYQAALNFTALGAVTNITTVPVTMIVNANTRAKVATWKSGRKGAMSVWIDDSDMVLFDELTTAGFAGTYALMGPGPQSFLFTSYYNAGMELGAHTHTHPCFPLNEPTRRAELENNIADIITSTPQTQDRLISFAWPCGANTTREKVWAADYFLISRGYNINQLEEPSPKDWMNVKSYNSHEHPPFPPSNLKTVVDAAIAQGKWANLSFHTMNNDDGAVAYAVGKDIWVGTGGDVTRYIMQRDRTVISNYVQTSGQIRFDCYRLGIAASNLRSFETSFNTNDTITFQVAVTNLAPVVGVTVGGVAKPYTIRSGGGATNLFFDTLVSSSVQPVVVTLSSLPVLTVTADNKTKVYRQSNPTLTGTLTGVQGGDNITATYTTTATTTSPVGTYPITPVLNDPNNRLGNYTVITNLGTLTITKSNAPITLGSLSQVYSGTARSATATTVPAGLTVNFTYNGQTAAPTNAGSYEVIGTINAANYAGSATDTLTVAKSNAPITLGSLSQVYNGTARSASATTVPPGLTVNFTYNGQSAAPTNAGSYQVIGTINDANYSGAATNTLTVTPAGATVNLTGLTQVYDGSARVVGASTVPPGLTVTLSYAGSANAPTNVGGYEVVGTVGDANYTGSTTNTLTVTPAAASVSLADLNQIYDGTARVVTASTTPEELTVTLTYDGSAIAPTNAGSYQVIGTINDLNYAGAATNTLTVAKSNAPVTLGDLSAVFNGAGHAATVTTVPAGLSFNLTYDGSASLPTNAGSYEVIGTLNELNYEGAATNTLVIAKSNAPVTLGDLSQGYDGAARSASATTVPPGLTVNLTYDGQTAAPTNVGGYQVIGTILEANYTGSTTNTLTVTPAAASVSLADLNQIYDGTARVVTASTTPEELTVTLTYDGSAIAPTNAGSYQVIGTINDLNYAGAATNTLTVAKSNAPVTLGDLSAVYDGLGHGASVSTVPSGLTVTLTYAGSGSAPTNAGSYEVIGTINDLNYVGAATNTLVIAPSNALVTLGNLSAVYDGLGHGASVSTVPPGLTVTLTYAGSGSAPTNAGSYEVIGTINDPNYTGVATNTLVIAPSNALVTLGNLSAVYDGLGHGASVSTVPSGLTVTLTYAGSGSAPTNAGSYEVIGTINDLNYTGAATNALVIATHLLSVTAHSANRMAGRANPVFTGSLAGVQNGDAITPSYSCSATVNSPLGDYDIVPTLADPDDRLGNYTVMVTNGVLTIVGAPQFLSITRTPAGTVNLVCEVYVGRMYEFQYKDNLADPEWTTFVAEFPAVSSSVEILDNAATPPQRFYRVVDVSDP